VAQFRTLEALQGACEFTLLFPAYHADQEVDAFGLKGRLSKVNFVPVRCYEPPMPLPPSPRMTFRRVLVNTLRKIFPAPKVHFEKTAELDLNTIKGDPEPLPYYPFHNLHPDFVKAVDKELDKGYDIFQAEFCEMLSLGPIVGDRAKKLFIHHQLHFIYAERLLKSLLKPTTQARYLAERMRLEEKAFLECFDTAVVFSNIDADLLRGFSPSLQVEVSPFPSPENITLHSPIGGCEGHDFVFVASESHKPNAMGLAWFMEAVWPKLKANLPTANIIVVGKWSQSAQASIPAFQDICFQGFVPELSAALRGKIMVVPLWVGSGIRTKILAAWSAGVPVVTTTIGAEGLPGEHGKHYWVADNADSFAAACEELAGHARMRSEYAQNGLNLVESHYSLEAVKNRRLEIYNNLLAN
jgi:glycosyltransferase involved in cell wall biosynthesis